MESGGSTTPQWSKSYIYLGARLLSTLTPNGSGGEAIQYHHPDRLGTRLVTNAQDTTSFEQVTLPFGTALAAESSGSTNRRFTSYDRSVTTGLDYAINRHYDPQQGRFTQVDPIGMNSTSLANPQTLNLYAYCTNDPINHVDPSGLGFFSKLFKWIGKALKILSIVALVVMTVIIFAPASSFIFKAALWMFFHVLLPLSHIPVLGAFVPLGMLGSPQWNPNSRSVFGTSWQGQGQDPDVIRTDIFAPRPRKWNPFEDFLVANGIALFTATPTPVHASQNQINAFRVAFENARDRILRNSKCAKLFGGFTAAIKGLYNHYGFTNLGGPSVVNGIASVIGAATLPTTRSVSINSSGPFVNQRLYVPGLGRFSTFDFGSRLSGPSFGALILLHELGHVRGVFGPDSGNQTLNRSHTQRVQDACF